jgi:hypothetical protein
MTSWNRYIAVSVLVFLAMPAWAGVKVTRVGESAAEIVVVDASNGEILEVLGAELGFEAVVTDTDWAGERRSFSRSADIEKLLKSVLSGSNYVLSYRDDKITGVAVLLPGSGNPVLSIEPAVATNPNPVSPAQQAQPRQADRRRPAARDTAGRASAGGTLTAGESATEEDLEPEPTPISDLLRVRMNAGATSAPAGADVATRSDSLAASYPGSDYEVDQATMRKLTRQVHQDVKHLAEMLRHAEAQLEAQPPE